MDRAIVNSSQAPAQRQFAAAAQYRLVTALLQRGDLDSAERELRAQLLFLMTELRTLAQAAAFPTEPAERLAAQFLEAERARPGEAMLEASGVRGLYQLTAPGGGVIALYRTATVIAAMDRMLTGHGRIPADFGADAIRSFVGFERRRA